MYWHWILMDMFPEFKWHCILMGMFPEFNWYCILMGMFPEFNWYCIPMGMFSEFNWYCIPRGMFPEFNWYCILIDMFPEVFSLLHPWYWGPLSWLHNLTAWPRLATIIRTEKGLKHIIPFEIFHLFLFLFPYTPHQTHTPAPVLPATPIFSRGLISQVTLFRDTARPGRYCMEYWQKDTAPSVGHLSGGRLSGIIRGASESTVWPNKKRH